MHRHHHWWTPEESPATKAMREEAERRGITLPELIREKIRAVGNTSSQEPGNISPKFPDGGYGDGLDDARRAGHG